MAVGDSLRCCCVGGCPVVIGGLVCPESGNWRYRRKTFRYLTEMGIDKGVTRELNR